MNKKLQVFHLIKKNVYIRCIGHVNLGFNIYSEFSKATMSAFTYNHAIKPANSYILISLKEFDSLKRYTDCHLLHT